MKRRFFAFSLAFLLCAMAGYAQEGGSPIKVTITRQLDGSRTETTKDIDNHTSESKVYNASNKLVQRAVFLLDEQGREKDGVIYDAKDTVVSKVANNYDVLGQISEQVYTSPKGVLMRRLVYTRDINGRATIQAFDAQGNLIKRDGSTATPTPPRGGSRR